MLLPFPPPEFRYPLVWIQVFVYAKQGVVLISVLQLKKIKKSFCYPKEFCLYKSRVHESFRALSEGSLQIPAFKRPFSFSDLHRTRWHQDDVPQEQLSYWLSIISEDRAKNSKIILVVTRDLCS